MVANRRTLSAHVPSFVASWRPPGAIIKPRENGRSERQT